MSAPKIRRLHLHKTALKALASSFALSVVTIGLAGAGFWMVDPEVHSLTNGMWLAFTTAATVGYGDMVPSTPASRVFAVLVVLVGLAVLSLVTASVAAMFVENEERNIERDLLVELRKMQREIRHLREEVRLLKGLPPPADDGSG